jgi:CheY-like chemotaxis protein
MPDFATYRKPHFLLVDDDEDDSDIFKEVASEIKTDATVKNVDGYRSLIEYLEESAAALPDLIFLDINMPGKDGMQLLQELKADSRYRNIPIVMYTTSSSPSLIEKARALGAYAYIHKPDTLAVIRNIFRQILNADWTQARGNNFFLSV